MKNFIETNVRPRLKALIEIGPGVMTQRLMDMAVYELKKKFHSETEESIMQALDDAGIRVGTK